MKQPKFKAGLGKRSEDVLFELRSRLDHGVYSIGALLPVENELCEELGVGRSTLRRAVARLVDEGRLQPRRGAGTTVLPKITPCGDSRNLATMFPLHRQYFQKFQEYALSKQVLLVPFDRPQNGWSPVPEKAFLECVRQARYRGILACCTPEKPHNDDLLAAMEREGLRVIHLEPYKLEGIDGSYIFPDYRRAGYAAATKLLLSGYKTLRYLRTEYDWPAAALAREGYLAGFQDHLGRDGLSSVYLDMPSNIEYCPGPKNKFLAELAKLETGTGLLCHDYWVASQVLEYLREAGKSVPDQVGLICLEYFDESIEKPPLDFITFDRAGALQRALDWVFTPDAAPLQDLLPPLFVARGSVRV